MSKYPPPHKKKCLTIYFNPMNMIGNDIRIMTDD